MLRVHDLPESTLKGGYFLFCPHCGGRWSAARGDYFFLPADTELVCEEDETPYVLARESIQIAPVAL